MLVGTEWIVDAAGCRAGALRDVELLRATLKRVIAELNLQPLGEPIWHQFPEPGGVTGLVMLTESHLACHTYPEHETATFNLYCCRSRPAWPWRERLAEMLGAKNVKVRVIERGSSAALSERTYELSEEADESFAGAESYNACVDARRTEARFAAIESGLPEEYLAAAASEREA